MPDELVVTVREEDDLVVAIPSEEIAVTLIDEDIVVQLRADEISIEVAVGIQGPPGADGAPGSGSDRNIREVTDAGDVTVDAEDDDIVIVNKIIAATTNVNLPPVGDRDTTRSLKIVDGKLDAATNNITVVPDGSETIIGQAQYVIYFDGGSVELWARPDGTGWYI